MGMRKDIPIFKLKIDEGGGVDYVAFVDKPAIEREWVAFAKEKSTFKIADEQKRIVSGPLMIADLPIYRRSDSMGEYYAVFDRETISQITQRYFKNKFTSNVNLMHEPTAKVNDVFMFESYLIDRERGIKPPKGFEGVTDGSWFGTFKVENEEVWQEFIATNKLRGFSVEGEFIHEPYEEKPQTDIEKVIDLISRIKP